MPPKKTRRGTAQPAKKQPVEEEVSEPPAPEEPSSSMATRPRRTTRRNQFYNNDDYDIRTSARSGDAKGRENSASVGTRDKPVVDDPAESPEPTSEAVQASEEVDETSQENPEAEEKKEPAAPAPAPQQLDAKSEKIVATSSRSRQGKRNTKTVPSDDQEGSSTSQEAPKEPVTPSRSGVKRGSVRAQQEVAKKQKTAKEAAPRQRATSKASIEPAPILEAQAPKPKEDQQDIRPEVHQEILYDDEFFVDGSNLEVAEELEVPHDDNGPPVLGSSATFFDTEPDLCPGSEDESNSDGDEKPPSLEMNVPNRKRGRPNRGKSKKKVVVEKVKKQDDPYKLKQYQRASARLLNVAPGEQVAQVTASTNQRAMKLFEDEVKTTPQGDSYATVIHGCLSELLRKDRVVELITSPEESELIRQGGWFLEKPPRLPPLTKERVCYAFYVNGTGVPISKNLANDDLRPWSITATTKDRIQTFKPSVRRHPVIRRGEKLTVTKNDPRVADYYLTEYTARLPREPRLRKKIFYLSHDGQIYGNILILYDYTAPGPIPSLEPLPPNETILETHYEIVNVEETDENYAPFEPEIVEGSRGGMYLKLKPHLSAWSNNKKTLLDWLFNSPTLVESTGALNNTLPDLPPLIETVGNFVYFVPASSVSNVIHHASDGLSPWTTLPSGNSFHDAPVPRVRSTKRPLIQDADGYIFQSRKQRAVTDLCLVESIVVLARCKRIRRKLYYLQTAAGGMMGFVCYIYEFTDTGPIPHIVPSKIHGRYPQTAEDKWKPIASKEALDRRETMFDEASIMDGGVQMNMVDEMMEPDHQMMVDMHHNMEDVLNGGYDEMFNDEEFDKADTMDPFFDQYRQLQSGHVYLTVRHKRIATTFDTVLEWISNSNIVTDRGLLNNLKPGHPPIVSNARSYVFFVAGTAIFPHDINRDDFSPWSCNGTAQNPTCYRTKVRKLGITCEHLDGVRFRVIEGTDYKECPYHLVYLYSINPRTPRLRKKIYYVMETESKMVVSHAMIMYEYSSEGALPQLHVGSRINKPRKVQRQTVPLHDVFNDVSDLSEEEKECPFMLPAEQVEDGTFYMAVKDQEFWSDRNRQIHYLINRPALLMSLQCLNTKVPDFPPLIEKKGMFVFFVDGEEISFRTLTSDCLAPWSESGASQSGVFPTRRPKSNKYPLALNRDNQLRIWRNGATTTEGGAEFQLHVYTAILPRCPRLRKKIVYVMKGDRQVGNAMILYQYTEIGDIPRPISRLTVKNSTAFVDRLDPIIKRTVLELLKEMTPVEVSKTIEDEFDIRLNPMMIHYLYQQQQAASTESEYLNSDGTLPSSSAFSEMDTIETKEEMMMNDKMNVTFTNSDGTGPSTSQPIEHALITDEHIMEEHAQVIEPVHFAEEAAPSHPFLTKTAGSVGSIRGSQRQDALWRIAQQHLGAANLNETFDALFRVLYEKNESRLLTAINRAFHVEIIAADEMTVQEGEEVVGAETTTEGPFPSSSDNPTDSQI